MRGSVEGSLNYNRSQAKITIMVYYSMARPHLMQRQAGVTGEQTKGIYER